MNYIPDAQPEDFQQAASLAFREARLADMSTEVASLFAVENGAEMDAEADRRIAAAIRSRYEGKPSFRRAWWTVPIPRMSYDSRETPRLEFEVCRYLVASVLVWSPGATHNAALVGPLGRPETLTLPMVFLHAVLKHDTGRFAVAARSASHITYEIPGARPVRLPAQFVGELSNVLDRKSVSAWLEDFGAQGRSVMPLVAGNLLGLEFRDSGKTMSMEDQPWTPELLVSALTGLAYTQKEAGQMLARAGPGLSPDLTLKAAIRAVLQQAGRGG